MTERAAPSRPSKPRAPGDSGLGRRLDEMLRVDPVQLSDVGGLRVNVWTSLVLFTVSTGYLVWATRRRPGRESEVYVAGAPDQESPEPESPEPESPEALEKS